MKRITAILTLLLLTCDAWAQEMTVQAPKQVYVGDNFTVRFVVNDKASDFRGPSFQGFRVYNGPSQSSQTSMSFINGQMSRSSSTTFSYTLGATDEGTFTIGPASCTADGKRLESKSVSIKVEKMTQAQQQQRQQQQQQRQRQAYDPWAQQPQEASTVDEKTLFARTSVSNANPYQGEQIIITYKVYSQVPIRQYAIDKLPGNRGFWAEDLSANQRDIKQYTETLDGRQYMVFEIRKGALFAQESGRLTIEPLDLNVLAMVRAQRRRTGSIWDIFDDPFFNMAQAVEYPLHTQKLAVNVKPLPNRPDDFSGAVGSFSVKGGLNLDRVKANEALTYRLTVSGSGNLMLVTPPTPQFPSSFEVYDPQIEDNIKRTDNGVSGSRTYEWVLIPRTQGNFTIPAYRFVYFDPTTQQYSTLTIDAQQVQVDKGANTTSAYSPKDDVRLLNQDINYIHPIGKLKPIRTEDHAGLPFYLAAILIILAAVGAVIYGRHRQAARQDIAGLRLKRATRMAQKRLKKASAFLGPGNTDRFYEEIYKAIWGCLADKYNIELSQLNRDTVSACLADKQVADTQQQRIMKVLQDVDIARFAPGDAETQKQAVYTEALLMIAEL